jgi:hypothetical protein
LRTGRGRCCDVWCLCAGFGQRGGVGCGGFCWRAGVSRRYCVILCLILYVFLRRWLARRAG